MSNPLKRMQDRHGAPANGLGRANAEMKQGGVGVFAQTGTKFSNDDHTNRKVGSSQVGSDSGPRNPKISGIKQLSRTGGQGRKFAGKVGFEKATGTT